MSDMTQRTTLCGERKRLRFLSPFIRMPIAVCGVSFAVTLTWVGCASSRSANPVEIFHKQHPVEASAYTMLEPTSVAYIEYAMEDQYDTVDAIITGVERRKDDPAALAEYLQYLKRCVRVDPRIDPQWKEVKRRLRESDRLYFFKYKSEDYSDFGLLVLRNGNIVYRSPWGWQRIGGNADEVFPRDGLVVDDL